MAPIGNVTSADDLSPSYSATMAPYSVTSAQYEPTLLAPTSAGFGLSEDVKWLILAVISALGVVVGIVGLIKSWKWCRSKRERSQSRQQQCELVPLTDTAEWSTSDVQSQAAAKCKDALKEHYRTTGSYVHLNPWCDEDQKRILDIYTRWCITPVWSTFR
ncbi:uncharacterized protein LOC110990907 isoform X2 [Acanthaster planci]|uniref:Uncharacterized protein LOC110990907 isoform X2 n=1 Tax=Acanthaster planci TaxID=133434 RepID=A0A8B8A1X1_ACAPL|nr:uncharacterized protein LOC110990907 isoform X2 [Acanthaster planci]